MLHFLVHLVNESLFLLFITFATYSFGLFLYRKFNFTPIFHPVLVSSVLLYAFLQVAHVPIATYVKATNILVLLLPPVIVALALPIYENRLFLKRNLFIVITSIVAGSVTTAATGIGLCYLFGLNAYIKAMFVKAATTPIALSIGVQLGISMDLIIVYTVFCGFIGAVLGLPMLRMLRLHTKVGSGLALGTCSHAFGTMSALAESKKMAGFAATAFALNGFFVAVVVPLLFMAFS